MQGVLLMDLSKEFDCPDHDLLIKWTFMNVLGFPTNKDVLDKEIWCTDVI